MLAGSIGGSAVASVIGSSACEMLRAPAVAAHFVVDVRHVAQRGFQRQRADARGRGHQEQGIGLALRRPVAPAAGRDLGRQRAERDAAERDLARALRAAPGDHRGILARGAHEVLDAGDRRLGQEALAAIVAGLAAAVMARPVRQHDAHADARHVEEAARTVDHHLRLHGEAMGEEEGRQALGMLLGLVDVGVAGVGRIVADAVALEAQPVFDHVAMIDASCCARSPARSRAPGTGRRDRSAPGTAPRSRSPASACDSARPRRGTSSRTDK